jgi:hypothetical protein
VRPWKLLHESTICRAAGAASGDLEGGLDRFSAAVGEATCSDRAAHLDQSGGQLAAGIDVIPGEHLPAHLQRLPYRLGSWPTERRRIAMQSA